MNPLLIRRRGMMGAQSVTPHDGQLEWIKTDGNAYIEVPNLNAEFYSSSKSKVLFVDSDTSQNLCGVRTSSGNSLIYAILRTSNSERYYSFGRRNILNGSTYSFGYDEPVEVEHNWVSRTNASITLKRNGVTLGTFTYTISTNEVTSSLPIHIFGYNYNGTHVGTGNGVAIYSIKLYGSANFNDLVFDGIPYRKNGEVGLMDTLTNTFFAPQGGTLTGGPNVI